MGRGFASFATACCLIVACATVRLARLSAFSDWHRNQRYEDTYYLPPTAAMRALSLGYEAALADLVWTRSLVYFGEELVRRGQAKHLFEHADAILVLDPDFRSAYRWAAVAALYRAKQPTLDDAERAVRYLERAVERWPDDGQLAWDLGATLRFELAPLVKDPAKRRMIEERAIEPLANAARKGAGPQWLALNSSSLLEKLGKKEQAIRHLEEMYGAVSDPDVKKEIARRLSELRSQAYAAAFQEANAAFEQARRSFYPYLSPSLFLLVGEPAAGAQMAMRARYFWPEDDATLDMLALDPHEASDRLEDMPIP